MLISRKFVLISGLLLVLAGCGDKDSAPKQPSVADSQSTTPDQQVKIDPNQQRLDQLSIRQHLSAAQQYAGRFSFFAAERELERVLKLEPDNLEAHRFIAKLLYEEGRNSEAAPHVFQAIVGGQFTFEDLSLLAMPDEPFPPFESEVVTRALKAVPDNPRPLVGEARRCRKLCKDDEAAKLLRRVVKAAPELAEAQALLGHVLLDLAQEKDFADWHGRLPAEVSNHPEIWFVRGAWAEINKKPKAAARSYWEAVKRNPNHRRAIYRLARVLDSLDRKSQTKELFERAKMLSELKQAAADIYENGPEHEPLQRAARLTEDLGRLWEAWGWHGATLAKSADSASEDPTVRQEFKRLRAILDREPLPRTLASANPAVQIDLSSFPSPNISGQITSKIVTQAVADSNLVFSDVAESVGISFRYLDSASVAKDRYRRTFETTGGGVAVLDYDGDGWPDLYFTQCCPWPPSADQQEYRDQLFRNLGDGTFANVTDAAGLGDNAYSQGVAVGDINNDGFPDLYVANIGRNYLYINNGQGAFQRTEMSFPKIRRWTTSCLIADLNADGFPDIYDVNYLSGNDVYGRDCRDDRGRIVCPPSSFSGEQDSILWNQGDGSFRDATRESGIFGHRGKGLGIVAARFNNVDGISVFVANDAYPNFYFVEKPASTSGSFINIGFQSGLACNRDGKAQACMGVAVEDLDHNGLLDMFVTNFSDDSNTIYIQQAQQLFSDETRRWGLRNASIPMVGFGTQFIDGELDGVADLVVTNGHISDYRARGEDFEMPPQYFRNLGNGRFSEISKKVEGDYFKQKYLGRGLARLDWNRDGLEDFVVSNIGANVSLVTNQTPRVGHYLTLRLRGVSRDRDAIGTIVEIQVDGRKQMRQLTAGDGYQASNQRQLVFGLGAADRVDKLTVTWPSGLTESFDKIDANHEWLLVESAGELNLLR